MRTETTLSLLSILVSVALSSLGAVYYMGQYTSQIGQNTTDIASLQASNKEMRELVTDIRIDMASQSATTNSKLDTIMGKLK